jgi:DNA-binding MarR family transcriptional regulator
MHVEDGESADLATALIRLCFVVQGVYGEASRRYGLTPQQTQLLGVLAGGPVGMAELGEALRLEKSSLSGLIDRAEARELVDRVRDASDRRTCQVSLTESGRDLAAQFRDYVSGELNALAVDLPDDTARQMIGTMWEIISAHDVSAIFGCAAPSSPDAPAR